MFQLFNFADKNIKIEDHAEWLFTVDACTEMSCLN